MPLADLSRFLLELYGSLINEPAGDFREWVLARLSETIGFDSGVWASGAMTAQGPDFHTVTLWRQPPQMLIDYDRLKHLDPLFAASARAPGKPVRATSRASLPAVFIPYVERYGLEQAMSTMHTDPRSQMLAGVSIWRNDRAKPFDAVAAETMEAVFPHLMAVATQRVLNDLGDAGRARTWTGFAAVDTRGRLHASNDRFTEAMVEAFPHWLGPDLPEPLLGVVRAKSSKRVLLPTLAVQIMPHETLIAVQLRARTALDELTARQRQIVEMSAQGLNHKQLARDLGLSPTTVRNHIAHAYKSLGVRNRAELAALLHRLS